MSFYRCFIKAMGARWSSTLLGIAPLCLGEKRKRQALNLHKNLFFKCPFISQTLPTDVQQPCSQKEKKASAWQPTRLDAVHPTSAQAVRRPRLKTTRSSTRNNGGQGKCLCNTFSIRGKSEDTFWGGSRHRPMKHHCVTISFSWTSNCHILKNKARGFAGHVQAVIHSYDWNGLVPECVRRDVNHKTVSPKEKSAFQGHWSAKHFGSIRTKMETQGWQKPISPILEELSTTTQ